MMKKQKVCIIGGSLAGLITANAISKLNCKIDLISNENYKKIKSNRTTAISQNSLDFLNKLSITKSFKKIIWPCTKMKIYVENKNEVFQLEKNKNEKKVLYMLKNSEMIKMLLKKLKKTKSISMLKSKNISEIKNSGMLKSIKINKKTKKYNLIILCVGNNSDLVKKIFKNNKIENSYKEISITTNINHKYIKNNTARQFFLDNEIIALLPISNTETSVVISQKKCLDNNNKILRKKIKLCTKNFLQNINFKNKFENRDLTFLLQTQYSEDRILLFGDALHVIHPFVGQGFNMILRDLSCLEKILRKKINLGLDLGSSEILSEFTQKTKFNNLAFSVGVDLLKNYFSIKNKYFKNIRNSTLKSVNKSNFLKNMFFGVADKGFKF